MTEKIQDENSEQTISLPLMCDNGGHQVYIFYFPQINRYGFGCGVCHRFGTSLTRGNKVLEIYPDTHGEDYRASMMTELMMGLEARAIHQGCPKGHFLMAYEFSQGFGFGCIHCKVYALQITDKNLTLEFRVTRELDPHDPKVKPLTGKMPNEKAPFLIN